MSGGEGLTGYVAAVAAPTPTPAGGSVAAWVGALSAALAQMVAGLTVGRRKYAGIEAEMQDARQRAAALGERLAALAARDEAAYAALVAARQLPAGQGVADAVRARAVQRALLHTTEVPLETARAAAEVAGLAAWLAERGNASAAADAAMAALLAAAACRGSACNVRVNGAGLADQNVARELADEAGTLAAVAADAAARGVAAAERGRS